MAENIWTAVITGLTSIGLSVGSFSMVVRGQNTKIKKIEDSSLDKEKHELMCKNSTLNINAHISKELASLKVDQNKTLNTIFKELRKIQSSKEA